MATCSKCGKSVGCGCNLISGKCHVCFNETVSGIQSTEGEPKKKQTRRIVYPQPTVTTEPNTEFEKILKVKGISKEEKIKRINDILEKAKQHVPKQ